jgi:hypothetical protein
MYGKQMELFNDGGLYEEGGMVDEVSGNEVPPGSTRKEVRDDIPAMLSEGEFVFPADVVRYFGLEKLMEMRQEAKMGMKKMEAMGQMGNSEEATIPDDLPFSPEDLDILLPQEGLTEMARGGVVKAQSGVFVQPSGFQGSTLNQPNNIPPSSFAPVVTTQGTQSGYGPTFLDQQPFNTTTGTTIDTSNLDEDANEPFVPTVNDVYTFKKYRNATTGEIRDIPFYMGEPVIPIPDGFVPYSEADTTATEDVTEVTTQSTQSLNDGGDGVGFEPGTGAPTGQEATPVGEMSDADIVGSLGQAQAIALGSAAIGAAINPAIGAVVGIASKARYNDLLEEAQRRGLDTGGRERMGSIFGGEASLFSGLQDQNGDTQVTFADTWLGDLLGLDGKVGVQGPNLQDSRRGARRGATTPTTTTTSSSRSGTPSTPSPSTSVSSGGGGGGRDSTPSTPGNTAANAPGSTANIGGQSVSIGYGSGQVDPGLAAAASAAEGGGRGSSTSGNSSGSSTSGSSSSSGTSSGGMSAADVASAQEAGKGYSGGYGFNKGGLAAKKQPAPKRAVNKDRGVAARKKK